MDPRRLRELIGPGGKNIKRIQEETGAQIDIEDTGEVRIAAYNMEGGKRAEEIVDVVDVDRSLVGSGERLRLREWDPEDEARFYAVMNRPEVMEHLGGMQTPEEWSAAYQRVAGFQRADQRGGGEQDRGGEHPKGRTSGHKGRGHLTMEKVVRGKNMNRR